MGGEARRFLEIGQRPEDEGSGRAICRDGVDEDDVPTVIARHHRREVLWDVLGVEDADVRPGGRLPDGSGDPRTNAVVAAEEVPDKDQTRRLPQEIREPGCGGGIENGVLRGLYTINGRRLYRESPA